MKMRDIQAECAALVQARVGGKDAEVVNLLRSQLLYTHWLVGITVTAIACQVFIMLTSLADFPSHMRGAYIKSEVGALLIFGAAYVVSRIVLAAFWVKHSERDFEVEITER